MVNLPDSSVKEPARDGFTEREMELLLILEEAASNALTGDGSDLDRFANLAFRIAHWLSAPGCRVNHPDFVAELLSSARRAVHS